MLTQMGADLLAGTAHRDEMSFISDRSVETQSIQLVICRAIADFCHHDFHHGIVEEMIRLYGDGVTVRFLHEEGQFLVESNSDDVPLARLVEDFGLVSRRQYADLHRRVYPALRAGRPPDPQQPLFAGRQPYTPMTMAEWERVRRSSD